jgi:hypothetical protein
MRILALVLLLAACTQEAPRKPVEQAITYAGEGRDRLCTKGDRAGFIAYGKNDSNCTAQGRIERSGEHLLTLQPVGDADCRIPIAEQAGTLRLGKAGAACSYYCGPDASFDGKAFTKDASASAAVDFAGDPLC